MRNYSKLTEFLKNIGYDISNDQIEMFNRYYEMLIEKNKVMNLTAITEFDDVVEKHFIDSLAILAFKEFKGINSFIDVGTGAGFPGIPLKIMFPEIKAVLIDSLGKRIGFLDEVKEELGLENIELIHTRSEDIAHDEDYREQFDLCVSRAVAGINVLSEYCLPLVKVGGVFIPYKSENYSEEVKEAEKALKILGGRIKDEKEYLLGREKARRIFPIIIKEKPTPSKYPRKAGVPNKKPL